jgi:hypothetical protein
VARCRRFFRQSGRFELAISYQKIGTILDLDGKTVWTPGRSL